MVYASKYNRTRMYIRNYCYCINHGGSLPEKTHKKSSNRCWTSSVCLVHTHTSALLHNIPLVYKRKYAHRYQRKHVATLNNK